MKRLRHRGHRRGVGKPCVRSQNPRLGRLGSYAANRKDVAQRVPHQLGPYHRAGGHDRALHGEKGAGSHDLGTDSATFEAKRQGQERQSMPQEQHGLRCSRLA